jgi:phosphate starvation-inducible protein PhoH and related proteins
MSPKRVSRKERRQQNQERDHFLNLEVSKFEPLTKTQEEAYQEWEAGFHLALLGSAGTGKTFCSLWFALYDMIMRNKYEKIMILRSAVPTRDMGFMPGTGKEKMSYYESPYVPIVNDICGRGDAWQILKQKDMIAFESTSYLRGVTFENTAVIVDECQSQTFVELDTIITRIGNGSRLIFSGDMKQDDLTNERKKEKSGLDTFVRIIENIKSFQIIDFSVEDIVRSGLVKEYLIEKEKLGY